MAKSFTPEEMESIRKNPNTWTVRGGYGAHSKYSKILDISMQKIQSIDFGDKKSANENL